MTKKIAIPDKINIEIFLSKPYFSIISGIIWKNTVPNKAPTEKLIK